jgi:hypothetical protein
LEPKPEDYRAKAAECLALADRVKDERAKRVLEHIAQSWLSLAERVEKRSIGEPE